MGISSRLKMIKNYIGWRKENKGRNFTSLFTVGDRNKIKVGDYTYGRLNVAMWDAPDESLSIGKYCSIATTARFICGGGHEMNVLSTYPFCQKFLGDGNAVTNGPIILDDDVWVGDSAMIMSGVHIGQGAVIGAGAIVTHDIPAYAVAVGTPARVVRYRFDEKIIEKLMQVDYTKLNPEKIKENISLLKTQVTKENVDEMVNLFK